MDNATRSIGVAKEDGNDVAGKTTTSPRWQVTRSTESIQAGGERGSHRRHNQPTRQRRSGFFPLEAFATKSTLSEEPLSTVSSTCLDFRISKDEHSAFSAARVPESFSFSAGLHSSHDVPHPTSCSTSLTDEDDSPSSSSALLDEPQLSGFHLDLGNDTLQAPVFGMVPSSLQFLYPFDDGFSTGINDATPIDNDDVMYHWSQLLNSP